MLTFEIFYRDLTPEAQQRLLTDFATTIGEENWNDSPLAILEREVEEEEEEEEET